MALVQWAGKSNALFLVVAAVPEVRGHSHGARPRDLQPPEPTRLRHLCAVCAQVQAHVAVPIMLICWGISEVRAPAGPVRRSFLLMRGASVRATTPLT